NWKALPAKHASHQIADLPGGVTRGDDFTRCEYPHHIANGHGRRIVGHIVDPPTHGWIDREKAIGDQKLALAQFGDRRVLQPEMGCLRNAHRAALQDYPPVDGVSWFCHGGCPSSTASTDTSTSPPTGHAASLASSTWTRQHLARSFPAALCDEGA